MSEIGQTLKNARVEKGLTLDDLQQTTKIQKRYLIAIEEDNFSALPGNFYVRAFIREYAETVGLDANEMLAEVDREFGLPTEQPTPANESVSRMNLREKNKDTELTNGQKILNYLPTIVIVVVVVAIIGTIFGVSYNNKRQAQKTVNDSVEVSSDVSSQKKTAQNKETSQKKTSSSAKVSSKKAKKSHKKTKKTKQKISLTANSGSTFTYSMTGAPKKNKIALKISGGTAWSAVSADGVQTWQGTLSDGEGQKVEVPAGTSTITIQLGNSQATSIKVNGKKFNFIKDNSTLTVRTLTLQLGESDTATATSSTTDTSAQSSVDQTTGTQAPTSEDQTTSTADTPTSSSASTDQ